MAIRTKGRNKINIGGRDFVWHVHKERAVRIASADNKFVVEYFWSGKPRLLVHSQEFPGIAATEERPVELEPPVVDYQSLAGLARGIIEWTLDEESQVTKTSSRRLLSSRVCLGILLIAPIEDCRHNR